MKISGETMLIAGGVGVCVVMLAVTVCTTNKIAKANEAISRDLIQIGNMLDEHISTTEEQYKSFVGLGD